MSNKITPVRVTFQPQDVFWINTLALRRDESKKQTGNPLTRNPSKLDETKTSFGVNVLGVMGELAAKRVHGGSIDTGIRRGGDGGVPDLKLDDGRMVEVKSTPHVKHRQPKLTLNLGEVDKAEHFCLVAVQLPDIVYVYPIIDRQELESKMKDHDYGYGNRKVYSYNS